MSDETPAISIIVPVYNTEKYLRQCLDSLVHQTMQNIEIICVNDGSPDHSLEILHDYAKQDTRVKVVDKPNGGLSDARNAGVIASTGAYILFVDSDDWVDPCICESLYGLVDSQKADCVMCTYIKEFGDHSVASHIFDRDLILKGAEVQSKIHRRLFGLLGEETAHPENADLIVSAWGQIFRRDICEQVRFVDTKKIGTEDCLYQIMVYAHCETFAYIDKPLYHYRKINADSITTNHKADLFEKWQNLYDIMSNLIADNGYPDDYTTALNNRIVFSLIGLGLNEVAAKGKSTAQKAKRLKQILRSARYQKAYAQFDFSYLPFQWRVFFGLCKHKRTWLLVNMLNVIEFLRKRA